MPAALAWSRILATIRHAPGRRRATSGDYAILAAVVVALLLLSARLASRVQHVTGALAA